jgi:hypothetical protein
LLRRAIGKRDLNGIHAQFRRSEKI